MLEDHRAQSKAEGTDPRADDGCTTAGGESSSFRSETGALLSTGAPACTGRAESMCPIQTSKVPTGFSSEIQGVEILDVSDSDSDNQCQQELFCFTGGHKECSKKR